MFFYASTIRRAAAAALFLIVFLAACQKPVTPALPTAIVLRQTETIIPTATTVTQPTETQTPSPTPPATLTQPPSPTITSTATPTPIKVAASDPAGSGLAQVTGCRQTKGSVEVQGIQSGEYGVISARTYLPPCYSAHPNRRYPVLYLLHGMNADDVQWDRLGVPDTADTLIGTGQTPPFIIVMPREDMSAQDPDVSQFDDWLVNVLVPWIDQRYPTCAERDCRAIGGLSRGSGWAFRIGLSDWQVFGSIGMHSFSPFEGDIQAMDSWLQAFGANQRPRLYMDIGTYDQAVPDAQQFEQKLTNLRFPHEWHLNDGAHNEDYWRAHVADYLLWYAEAWK